MAIGPSASKHNNRQTYLVTHIPVLPLCSLSNLCFMSLPNMAIPKIYVSCLFLSPDQPAGRSAAKRLLK
eukprot:scaffold31687_cov20-Tisochrysis_lutea.AAC.1